MLKAGPRRKLHPKKAKRGRRSFKLVKPSEPTHEKAKPIETAPVAPVPESKKGAGRPKQSANAETMKKLRIYIQFRDAGKDDDMARILTIQKLRLVGRHQIERGKASLNRAINAYLSGGDYSEEQAHKFRRKNIQVYSKGKPSKK